MTPTEPVELPDLLPPRKDRPLWTRVFLIVSAGICFLLGIVGWLVPVITGVPFYIAGAIFLASASEPCRQAINRWERKLPHAARLRARKLWYKMRWKSREQA